MIKHFQKLYEFDYWANNRVIETLANNSLKDTRIDLLFSHILNSQQIWYSRIKGGSMGQSPWNIVPQQNFLADLIIVHQNWETLLKENDVKSLRRTIEYKNFKGDPFKNTLEDILTHIVNHSTYHRAQISAQIKSLGKTPPITDYIAFARK